METRCYQVYKFDELSADGKEKAINKWRKISDETNDFGCIQGKWITERYKEELKEIGLEVGDIEWSGFWSQGDGARIQIKNVDFRKWVNSLPEKEKAEFHLLPMIADAEGIYSAGTVKNSYANHYSHSKTQSFVIETNMPDCTPELALIVIAAQEYIDEFIRDKSDKLYDDLEKGYEDVNSDDYIIDCLKANDYDLTADGEID